MILYWFVILLAFLVVGLVFTLAGLRGRVVGTDPHCRRCGFNLRGRDTSSTRCPECGAELIDRNIRTGVRQRRPVMLSIGALLLLLSVSAIGFVGWESARAYDWTRWKPTSWLLEDMERPGPPATAALRELSRRVSAPGYPQAKLDALADRLLDRQGDRSARWNSGFGDVFETAARTNRLDPPRVQRYLRQGVSVALEVKSKLRRKQQFTVSVDLKFDRYGENSRLDGKWEMTPLLFNDVPLRKQWAQDRNDGQLSGSIGYTTGVDSSVWKNLNTPDGKHLIASTLTATLTLKEPMEFGPVEVEVPVSTTVEVFPAGAVVDEFKVDESVRDAMVEGVSVARVTSDDEGRMDVRVKAGELPMPVAAEVFVVQGSAEQRIGMVLLEENRKPRWVRAYTRQKPKFTGAVEVHLRPAQEPADGTRLLKTYWGEAIVIRDVQVDAPYTRKFNNDESLRPAVEKAFGRPRLEWSDRKSGRLTVFVNVDSAPTKLAYRIYLRANGKEHKTDNGLLDMSKNSGYGYGRATVFSDTAATAADVIFRPDPDWEINTYDDELPWGGEMVFNDVPIESP